METIFYIFSVILQLAFFVVGAYFFVVSLAAWVNKKEKEPENFEYKSYAMIVAAHNEEDVIENMVDSLQKMNYPREKYDIFVIADNCTDSTASIARNAGAYVYERTNTEQRGKGYALEWMFEHIYKMDKKYDSIAIFDADNIVHPNFLREMNKKQNQGHKVVQGYIDSKNPFDSWITAAYTVSFWSVNKVFQMARYNLGLSCQLSGTGFVIDVDILKEIGWQATCLTEDMEFTMRLVLNNYKVAWSHHAVIYDEKPLTFAQSWKQRIRWMQGHADVATRFVGPLLAKAKKEKKWAPVDCVLYLLQPVRIIALGFITLMTWLQSAYPSGEIGFFQVSYLFPTWVWFVMVLVQFAYTPLIIWMERHKFSLKLVWLYLTYSIYTLTWVPIAIIGVINKDKKEWFHTKHTRKITIEEVNN